MDFIIGFVVICIVGFIVFLMVLPFLAAGFMKKGDEELKNKEAIFDQHFNGAQVVTYTRNFIQPGDIVAGANARGYRFVGSTDRAMHFEYTGEAPEPVKPADPEPEVMTWAQEREAKRDRG